MGGAMLQSPLSIPEYLGGIVRNGLNIRNQRVRKPLLTKFHVFRCPGEGRGRRRHPGMGPGSRREGGGGVGKRIKLFLASAGSRSIALLITQRDGGNDVLSNSAINIRQP